jgi:hypothetical protein
MMNTWYPLFGFMSFIAVVASLGIWASNGVNRRAEEQRRLNAERESHSRSAE